MSAPENRWRIEVVTRSGRCAYHECGTEEADRILGALEPGREARATDSVIFTDHLLLTDPDDRDRQAFVRIDAIDILTRECVRPGMDA